MIRRALPLLLTLCLASSAFADTGAQIAGPGFRAPDDSTVRGFRASLLIGEVDDLHGFDLGILSLSKTRNLTGFALVFGISQVTGTVKGGSGAIINLREGSSTGAVVGVINVVDSIRDGANAGFVNSTKGYSLVDVGGISLSQKSRVQVGIVNVTKQIESVQIGLINAAENGFFPVFPLFNFPKR
jgi:hypothetical protein